MAYIDRDTLLEFVKQNTPHINGETTLQCVENAIKEAPTADVVEVVRCKDCEHLEVLNNTELYAKCKKTQIKFLPFETDTRTHFCGYGKRKVGKK